VKKAVKKATKKTAVKKAAAPKKAAAKRAVFPTHVPAPVLATPAPFTGAKRLVKKA